MNAFRFIAQIMILATATSWASGQTSKPLSLDEAVRLGLDNSKQLKASNSRIDITKARLLQYKYATIPSINASAQYIRISDNITALSLNLPGFGEFVLNPQILNQFVNKLAISQVLYAGDRAKNTLKSGEYLEKAAELDFDKDKSEIKLNIINAYYNLYKLQETRDLLKESIKSAEGRLIDFKNYVQQGVAIDNDQMKAQLTITSLQTSLAEVENGIIVADYGLAVMLGLPDNTVFELDKGSLFAEKSVSNVEGYVNAGLANRAELQAADWRLKATEKGVDIAKGAYLPVITAGANVFYGDPNARVFPEQDAFKATWDVGVTVSYNFANLFSNKFNVQEARVNLAQVGYQKDQLSDGIKVEIVSAYYAYQTALKKQSFAEQAIVQAAENLRVTKSKFQSQVSTFGEVMDADVALLQTKINLATAKADTDSAYYKLMKTTGK